MCDCISQLNAHLKKQNTVLSVDFTLNDETSRVQVGTQKQFSTHHGKPIPITANYCPFCGKEYGTSMSKVQLDERSDMNHRIAKMLNWIVKKEQRAWYGVEKYDPNATELLGYNPSGENVFDGILPNWAYSIPDALNLINGLGLEYYITRYPNNGTHHLAGNYQVKIYKSQTEYWMVIDNQLPLALCKAWLWAKTGEPT